MKICFITNTVFNLGGVQRVVSVLASKLSENYEIDILCTDAKFHINRELYNLSPKVNIQINSSLFYKNIFIEFMVKVFRKINNITGLFNNKKIITILTHIYFPSEVQNNFINYLNLKKYDVIIGVEGHYSVLLGIISDRLEAKTIGWQHNSYEAYLKTKNKYYWKQDELFKEYLKKLDRYIVLTEDDKIKMKKYLNTNCERIYNPLSFISERKAKCVNKNIICVGRLVQEQKGIDLLIKAFSKVSLKYKDWKLYIIGDGPDKDEINKLVSDLSLQDQVIIKPFTNNVQSYYLNSSIFVSSSRWEGFGLVIIEAMECGLPVIAFANSGPKEIINKQNGNGILVPCEDIDKLSEAIINLIDNEEMRLKIAKGSIYRAKDFNIDIIMNQWNKILNKILTQ